MSLTSRNRLWCKRDTIKVKHEPLSNIPTLGRKMESNKKKVDKRCETQAECQTPAGSELGKTSSCTVVFAVLRC